LVSDIKIELNKFYGNTNQYSIGPNEESLYAVNISLGHNITYYKNEAQYTVGGVYITGENISVRSNIFRNVSIGNVVVSGSYIKIIENIIHNSGIGTRYRAAEGDAVTILGASSYVEIKENYIQEGNCYLIWIHDNANYIDIEDNELGGSITDGILVDKYTQNVVIRGNKFLGNIGNGLAINQNTKNIYVSNNEFIDDTIRYSEGSDINGNLFSKIKRSSFDSEVIDDLINKKNLFEFIDNADKENLLLIAESLGIIQNHQQIFLQKNLNSNYTFFIKNQGGQPIKMNGIPSVILSDSVLENQNLSVDKASCFSDNEVKIEKNDQLSKKVLFPEDFATFRIRLDLTKFRDRETIVVNIPTDSDLYKPFWFVIKFD